MIRRLSLIVIGVAAVILALASPAAACPQPMTPRQLTAWHPGTFAEALVAAPDGALLATVSNFVTGKGQVWRVDPVTGHRSRVGPAFAFGDCGVLTGITVGPLGSVYVAASVQTVVSDTACAETAGGSGVYRLADGQWRLFLSMPDGFPNGLTVGRGAVWATDSVTGTIWRRAFGGAEPTEPWLTDATLAPGHDQVLGANGIAVREGAVYVLNSGISATKGALVRVPVLPGEKPGRPTVVAGPSPLLQHADALLPSVHGGFWVTANGTGEVGSGALLRVTAGGQIQPVLVDEPWMDYPTGLAFSPRTGRLCLLDGAFDSGNAPDLRVLRLP